MPARPQGRDQGRLSEYVGALIKDKEQLTAMLAAEILHGRSLITGTLVLGERFWGTGTNNEW